MICSRLIYDRKDQSLILWLNKEAIDWLRIELSDSANFVKIDLSRTEIPNPVPAFFSI